MEQSSKNNHEPQKKTKKPMSDGAKVALILGCIALGVLLVAVICFYSFMNRFASSASFGQFYEEWDDEDFLSDNYSTLVLPEGTYKVPDDIEIAAYVIYSDSEVQFIATGADGEVDIKETLKPYENNDDNVLSVITEDKDTIQLIGSGKVTFVKVGEAEDYLPADNQNNNSPDGPSKGSNDQFV